MVRYVTLPSDDVDQRIPLYFSQVTDAKPKFYSFVVGSIQADSRVRLSLCWKSMPFHKSHMPIISSKQQLGTQKNI
jgi:hypothetical protein